MIKNILLLGIFTFQAFMLQAQCTGWTWPEDKATAEEKNVLYTDALRNDNFKAAKEPHRWLLENAPNLNTSIYINGEKIYKGLIDQTKDEKQKDIYIDSLMLIYDMRIQYCDDKADVMERKAYSAYRYNIKKRSEMPNILDLFVEAYKLNGKDIASYMHLPYMHTVVYNAKYVKNLSDEQILEHYDRIMESLNAQIENGGSEEDKLREYVGKIDGLLVTVVNVDCDFVRKNMAPEFEKNPNNLKLAKKIFSFMLNGKCTDDPLWLEAGKVILKEEPSFGLAKNLGIKFKNSDDEAQAEKYLKMAIELADNPADKAEMYLQLADMKSGSESMALYNKALEIDPGNKEAYNALGHKYFTSFKQCQQGKDIVKDRAVYLLAYDMYQKAGNTKMMQSSKEQFPSVEEIFTYNYKKGDKITVDCWGQSTVIRSRD